jgi:hypothetical protein
MTIEGCRIDHEQFVGSPRGSAEIFYALVGAAKSTPV